MGTKRVIHVDSRGRWLFHHNAYPTHNTSKGDNIRKFPLDLYRGNFFLIHDIRQKRPKLQRCEHYYPETIV